MKKSLSEMSLTELWQLFPIFLTQHNSFWEQDYITEKERLLLFLPESTLYINHIGSTAVNGIWAKPIIDILVETPLGTNMDEIKKEIVSAGYICMSEENNRISFNRGYTEDGFAEKVYHLHLRYYGDNDELYFRDYLNDDPITAKEYEKLKLSLWKEYEFNRNAYTDAKGPFIAEVTQKAKLKYNGRYSRKDKILPRGLPESFVFDFIKK